VTAPADDVPPADVPPDEVRAATARFAGAAGRRPRVLVAAGTVPRIAALLAGLGCDVDVAAPASPAGVADQAVDNDVHAVVVPSGLVAAVRTELDTRDRPDVLIVAVAVDAAHDGAPALRTEASAVLGARPHAAVLGLLAALTPGVSG
jgi:methylmalonyl-CoA mutase cobalamin-binding subunit